MNFSNLIAEVTAALSGGTIAGYVLLGMYGVILLLALIGAFKGLSRGLVRQVVRTVTVAASAVISYVGCLKVYPSIAAEFEGKTLGEVLEALGLADVLANLGDYGPMIEGVEGETAQYLAALPLTILILPLLFVIAFIVISAVMMIVFAIIAAILGANGKRCNPISRLLGFALGAGQGAAVGALLLIPVIGLCSLASAAMPELPADNAVKVMYTEYAAPTAESELFALLKTCGGDYVINGFNTITVKEGETEKQVNVGDSAKVLFVAYGKTGALSGADFTKLDSEQQAAVRDLTNLICDDGYLANLLAGVLRSGVDVAGQLIPIDDDTLKGVVDELLGIFQNIQASELKADLTTIENVYFILCDKDVLSGMSQGEGEGEGGSEGGGEGEGSGDMMTKLLAKDPETGDTIVNLIINELAKNTHTEPIIGSLTRMAMSFIAVDGVDAEVIEETFNDVKEALASVERLETDTDEQYADKVADSLYNVIETSEIELPPEIADYEDEIKDAISDYIVENIDELDLSNISEADMANMLLQFMNNMNSTSGEGGGEGSGDPTPNP